MITDAVEDTIDRGTNGRASLGQMRCARTYAGLVMNVPTYVRALQYAQRRVPLLLRG